MPSVATSQVPIVFSSSRFYVLFYLATNSFNQMGKLPIGAGSCLLEMYCVLY